MNEIYILNEWQHTNDAQVHAAIIWFCPWHCSNHLLFRIIFFSFAYFIASIDCIYDSIGRKIELKLWMVNHRYHSIVTINEDLIAFKSQNYAWKSDRFVQWEKIQLYNDGAKNIRFQSTVISWCDFKSVCNWVKECQKLDWPSV